MSATTVPIDEASYHRLLHLSDQTGRPAIVILEQALADYERKLSGGEKDAQASRPAPAAAEEAELLEDIGRILLPPRTVRLIAAKVVPIGRRVPQPSGDAED